MTRNPGNVLWGAEDNGPNIHEDNALTATPANMKRLCHRHNEPIAVPGVVAYSYETGETYSASPGDYFLRDDNDCLTDSEGNEMVLVEEVRTVVMQEIED